MDGYISDVTHVVEDFISDVNDRLSSFSPSTLVLVSSLSSVLLLLLVQLYNDIKEDGVFNTAKKKVFRVARRIPWVAAKVEAELGKNMAGMKEDAAKQMKGLKFRTNLPEEGMEREVVLGEINKYLDMADFKIDTGALSGTCHQPGDASRVELVTAAYSLAAYTNPLNPDAFPGVRKMEAEVVRMTASLFHGSASVSGTMTSGGTESLILSVLAYRGYAREERGVTRPNLVMADTGHVGFDKAGHLLGVAVRKVPVSQETWTPSLKDVRAAVDSNTIMIVASAPQYAHGIMDPVEEIARLGLELDIPVHVDACLGGFLLAFMHEDDDIPPFDFSVAGVTSLSADTHKFGYAPKGSSVILYRHAKHRHHQYYVQPDWTGGIFVSPTLAGSRSGGIITATWAALVNHGLAGYKEATAAVIQASRRVRDGIKAIPGLQVLGDPQVCIVAFRSPDFHIFRLADSMKKQGWLLSCLQHPTAVQLYVVPSHTRPGVVDKFLEDLGEATREILANPAAELEGRAAVYGMAQKIPDRSLVRDLCVRFMDVLYDTGKVSQDALHLRNND